MIRQREHTRYEHKVVGEPVSHGGGFAGIPRTEMLSTRYQVSLKPGLTYCRYVARAAKGHGRALRTAYPARVVPGDESSLQFGGVHDRWNDLGFCTRCKELDGNLSVIALHAPAHVPLNMSHDMGVASDTGLCGVSPKGPRHGGLQACATFAGTMHAYLALRAPRVRGSPRIPFPILGTIACCSTGDAQREQGETLGVRSSTHDILDTLERASALPARPCAAGARRHEVLPRGAAAPPLGVDGRKPCIQHDLNPLQTLS